MKHDLQIRFTNSGAFKSITTWHPIDGVWVRIEQRLKDGKMEYITDGEIAGISDVSNMEVELCKTS